MLNLQQPAPPPALFSFQPNYNKFTQLKANNLQSVNVLLESSKNKNFNVEYNGLLAGSDLKSAEEYTNKINYGVKTLGGGVFSLNATNQKLYSQAKEQSYLGFSYNLSSRYTSVILNYKSINANTTGYLDNSLMEINVRSRF